MKSVSGVKSNNFGSPKTPGGISKSLLTPCRRIGLSRNWKKSGSFQSPLSSSSEVKEENAVNKKRKESDEILYHTPENDSGPLDPTQTPTKIELPRRKKSKTLLSAINKSLEHTEPVKFEENFSNSLGNETCKDANNKYMSKETNLAVASSPVCLKTKSKSKNKITPNSSNNVSNTKDIKENLTDNIEKDCNKTVEDYDEKKSPNNLTKECIVVLQKKIFANELKSKNDFFVKDAIVKQNKTPSDSDSDDIPLVHINREFSKIEEKEDDFAMKPKIITLDKTSKSKSKSPKVKTTKVTKVKEPILQNSEDDDDFAETKKTILIRKSYNKVIKPQKAKSTGSITQRDIDELKTRIEMKKKMLLAESMSDTKELRDLIKKWQRGCQEALIELMNLMKNKFPDKQNMDYSEILESLKIPPSLVGYDSDNDCFLTPDDEDIILSKFKN